MKAVLAVLAIVVVLIVTIVGSISSVYNTAVRYETNIKKLDEASKNTLSAYTLKVREMAQVPAMYKKDLESIIKQTFEGRYGKDGSKAVMQFITENNLQFDSSMYKNLQVVMQSGRDEFKLSQDRKLDICADYENKRGQLISGFFLQALGFPKQDIDNKCKIVLDAETNETFLKHEAKPIKL